MEVGPVPLEPESSLLVVRLVRFEMRTDGHGAVEALVVEVIRTCTLAPAARSPWLQVSTPPLIEQLAAVVPAASICQFRPELVGSVSVMTTPWARPGPALVAVIV